MAFAEFKRAKIRVRPNLSLLRPTAKQLAVAFDERITLELRKRLAGFVGAARPHSDQGGRTNVSEMVDQPCVVLEVILKLSPRASSRLGPIVHRAFLCVTRL